MIGNSYTSKKDSHIDYDGGPSAAATLSTNEGLNRFVWNMRHPIMPGVTNAYLEANFSGHTASPGPYLLNLEVGDSIYSTQSGIEINPLYEDSIEDYQIYDEFMTSMESNLRDMHQKVNALHQVQDQLKEIINYLKKNPNNDILEESGIAFIE